MTHEQKPESAEFLTTEEHALALRHIIDETRVPDRLPVALAHVRAAEARGAAEQRRKDAEGAEPRTRERLVSDLAARLVADGVLVRIAKEIAQDHISRAVEEGGIAIDRTNARIEQLVGHALFRGDDSVFRRIAIEKRRSDNFLSRYTADASNAHRRRPANVAALEARVKELEGAEPVAWLISDRLKGKPGCAHIVDRTTINRAYAEYQATLGFDVTPLYTRPANVTALIAEAVAAERERCAKVCEERRETFADPAYAGGPIGAVSEMFACKACAAAIREGGE